MKLDKYVEFPLDVRFFFLVHLTFESFSILVALLPRTVTLLRLLWEFDQTDVDAV